MTPLNTYLDVDALDALLTAENAGSRTPVRVSFTYGETGTRVTASGDGQVTVSLETESPEVRDTVGDES